MLCYTQVKRTNQEERKTVKSETTKQGPGTEEEELQDNERGGTGPPSVNQDTEGPGHSLRGTKTCTVTAATLLMLIYAALLTCVWWEVLKIRPA